MDKAYSEIDWSHWEPDDNATIVFIIRQGQILLIRKKRGLGAGKVNGPGGRFEPGEEAVDCAIREVQEELLVTPVGLEPCGQLNFQFTDGYGLRAYVFKGHDVKGVPTETDEADPFWCAVDCIPFDQMWADDAMWFPYMFRGIPFVGCFVFDGEKMLTCDLRSGANLN